MRIENVFETLRPKTVDNLICDSSTRLKLERILKSTDSYRAYLLSGPSGMGKTSFARIFAKCVWAESTDLVELNCADTRGIDFARELLGVMSSRPLMSQSKVIILDEAHMLTPQAQNTLLKGIENLPKNNYVIICSTNPEGLVNTIITRCYKTDLTPELENKEFCSGLDKLILEIKLKRNIKVNFSGENIFEVRNNFISKNSPENFSIRNFIAYVDNLLDLVEEENAYAISKEKFEKIIKSSGLKYDPIILARYLAKNSGKVTREHFKQLIDQVLNLNCTIEQARLVIINYLLKVLSSSSEETANYILDAISEFIFDGTTQDSRAKMLLAFRKIRD